MNVAVRLALNPAPDAYGFIYGQLHHGAQHHNIKVMPPVAHRKGRFELEGHEPDKTNWILYIDGAEVARVRRREDIVTEFSKVIIEG